MSNEPGHHLGSDIRLRHVGERRGGRGELERRDRIAVASDKDEEGPCSGRRASGRA